MAEVRRWWTRQPDQPVRVRGRWTLVRAQDPGRRVDGAAQRAREGRNVGGRPRLADRQGSANLRVLQRRSRQLVVVDGVVHAQPARHAARSRALLAAAVTSKKSERLERL